MNKELNLNQCMDILNEMMKSEIEHDSGGGEITYIVIDSNKIDCLRRLIPNEGDLRQYLATYGEFWPEEGFDIVGIWCEIASKFNEHILVNFKEKEFYIDNNEVLRAMKFVLKLRKINDKYRDRKEELTQELLKLWDNPCSPRSDILELQREINIEARVISEIREDFTDLLSSDFVEKIEEDFANWEG